jgi:hypothetical protein
MYYDIIGDLHGFADQLKKLLLKMGYRLSNGCYSHPTRKAVFLGDYINRGPKIKETISIIRKMVEAGSAYAVIGNHELYAILSFLRDDKGAYFKKSKYRLQIDQTLTEFSSDMLEFKSYLKWFRTLPLFLDFGKIRVAHACWNDENIMQLKKLLVKRKIKKALLREVAVNKTPFAKSFWETVKGVDFQLPNDLLIFDEAGHPHRSFRMKWWENPQGKTFHDISLESRFRFPPYTIPKEIVKFREPYPESEPIVFFGHYSLVDGSGILTPNICCLDLGISRSGKLMAYRWSGEEQLLKSNFVIVS